MRTIGKTSPIIAKVKSIVSMLFVMKNISLNTFLVLTQML